MVGRLEKFNQSGRLSARSRPYQLSSDSAVFYLSPRFDALRRRVCCMDGGHAAALSSGHLPDRASSDRHFGGAFAIPCVLQFLSRTEWVPTRRVDGIVPRLDGATASIIRGSSWPADLQATNRYPFSVCAFGLAQMARGN